MSIDGKEPEELWEGRKLLQLPIKGLNFHELPVIIKRNVAVQEGRGSKDLPE